MTNRWISILTLLLTTGLVLGLSAPAVQAADDAPPTSATKIVMEPDGNQMTYATTEFSVEPGEKVRLVFKNTASSPAMMHNVVLLTNSDDAVVRPTDRPPPSLSIGVTVRTRSSPAVASTKRSAPSPVTVR